MAFYKDEDDENQESGQESNDSNITANRTGSESAIISGQGATSASPITPLDTSAPDQPGNWVGIKSYLDQNKPQTEKLASDIGSHVEGLGNTAKNALETQSGLYNQAVDSGVINYNENLFNDVTKDASSVASDEAKKAEVIKQRTAQYGGPSSFEESDYFNPANSAIQNAQQAAEKTKSEAGQKQLIQETKNVPKLNQGVLGLDSALLQSDSGAQEKLNAARASQANLANDLSSFQKDALNKALTAKTTTENTKSQANAALNNNWQSLKDLVNGKVTNAQQNYVATSDLGKDLTDKQLASLGISKDLYKNILSDPITANLLSTQLKNANKLSIGEVNANTVASSEDYAREQALMDLMGLGSDDDFISSPEAAGTGLLSNKVDPAVIKKLAIDEAQKRATEARNAAKAQYANVLSTVSRQSPNDPFIQQYAEQNIDAILASPAKMKYEGVSPDYANSIAKYKNDIAKYNSWS